MLDAHTPTQNKKEYIRKSEDMIDEANSLFRNSGLTITATQADPTTKTITIQSSYADELIARSTLKSKGWSVLNAK
jgi:hypothetical protein